MLDPQKRGDQILYQFHWILPPAGLLPYTQAGDRELIDSLSQTVMQVFCL